MSAQPFLNADGEQVGWIVPVEDGETYLTELDGSIAAVWDHEQEGWDLDVEVDDTGDDDQLAYLHERLDDLEEIASQPHPIADVMVTRGLETADVDRIEADMHAQAEHLEAALGRPLLIEERRRIAAQVANDIEAGDARPDLYDAAAKSGGLLDLDGGTRLQNHEARVEFMAQRMRDEERVAAQQRGEDDVSYDEPPATQSVYDLDDRAERQAYMTDRARGVTDAGAGYITTDEPEEWAQ